MFGPDDVRPCTRCNSPLRWNPDLHTWEGQHKPACPVAHNPARQANEIANALKPGSVIDAPEADYEYVAGPTGAQLWSVTASTGRTVGGEHITDTFHVRADSYDGALLIAREMRPFIHDAEAVKIDG
jgi:hypothetical protein